MYLRRSAFTSDRAALPVFDGADMTFVAASG